MKKLLLLLLVLTLILTACDGDFIFEEATVVAKSVHEYSGRWCPCYNYLVTVEYNGSNYNVPVDDKSYRIATEGSRVKVYYTKQSDWATLTPIMKKQ
jgi:Zn/Cd-binding protein ZinT